MSNEIFWLIITTAMRGLMWVLSAGRRWRAADGVSASRWRCTAPLWFWRDAFRSAGPADHYCAFRMAYLRGCYRQILGPRLHATKFTDGSCGHADVWIRLNLHRVRQAPKGYVECSNAFGFVSHKDSLTVRYAKVAMPEHGQANHTATTRAPRKRNHRLLWS